MDNGPDWVILLMYWSHDMRHRFLQVDGGQRDPWDQGVTISHAAQHQNATNYILALIGLICFHISLVLGSCSMLKLSHRLRDCLQHVLLFQEVLNFTMSNIIIFVV